MDLISVAIRTIFYDANIAEVLNDLNNTKHKYIESYFNKLAASHEKSFTLSELNSLKDYVKQCIGASGNYLWSNFFRLLPLFEDDCLEIKDNIPTVKYYKLKRWRELSLLIGEDLFVTSFLARKSHQKITYDWNNVIGHDNKDINGLFCNGVADIHSHLGASADVFELTWLDLMNYVVNKDETYNSLFAYNDLKVNLFDAEKFIPVPKLIQIAAFLRLHLFVSLKNKIKDSNLKKINNLLSDSNAWTAELKNTQSHIDSIRKSSGLDSENSFTDYCIDKNEITSSIYAIHIGERKLLFLFFNGYFDTRQSCVEKDIADYMFIYLLVKSRIRREFIQTNQFKGFENFKAYQRRKNIFISLFKNSIIPYAIKSSFRDISNNTCLDFLESRLAPLEEKKHGLIFIDIPDSICLNSKEEGYKDANSPKINNKNLTFVVHLLKSPALFNEPGQIDSSRFCFRKKYQKQIDTIIYEAKRRLETNKVNVYHIVGLDAAGDELTCPPEEFGHVYRYAKACGLVNLTYHVGEDFYDLIDGLMNIYNAIIFLELQENCRLGHAIALGVVPERYYRSRGFQLICSKQKMLDILVWVIGFCKDCGIVVSSIDECIHDRALQLYKDIGYKGSFKEEDVYDSILLRGDDLFREQNSVSKWAQTNLCRDGRVVSARVNQRACEINRLYCLDKNIISNGKLSDTFIFPDSIIDIVQKIQMEIINVIRQRGLVIECCPTSNYCIGPINTYEDEPLFEFYEKGLPVTVNTDDKGIFATSEINELSLVSATRRANLNGNYPIGLVRQLIENGKKYRFKGENLHLSFS